MKEALADEDVEDKPPPSVDLEPNQQGEMLLATAAEAAATKSERQRVRLRVKQRMRDYYIQASAAPSGEEIAERQLANHENNSLTAVRHFSEGGYPGKTSIYITICV